MTGKYGEHWSNATPRVLPTSRVFRWVYTTRKRGIYFLNAGKNYLRRVTTADIIVENG